MYSYQRLRVCVCVRACVRACVCVRACARALHVYMWGGRSPVLSVSSIYLSSISSLSDLSTDSQCAVCFHSVSADRQRRVFSYLLWCVQTVHVQCLYCLQTVHAQCLCLDCLHSVSVQCLLFTVQCLAPVLLSSEGGLVTKAEWYSGVSVSVVYYQCPMPVSVLSSRCQGLMFMSLSTEDGRMTKAEWYSGVSMSPLSTINVQCLYLCCLLDVRV